LIKAVHDLSPQQLREAAFAAILHELGPIGLARFVRENGLGSGDYTRDRDQWLPQDASPSALVEEWRARNSAEPRKEA